MPEAESASTRLTTSPVLLVTGCRRGEIVRLRWSEVRGDMLMLADSKTGPRKVPLNSQAQRILERQPRGERPFEFPSPRDPSRPRHPDLTSGASRCGSPAPRRPRGRSRRSACP